MSEQYWIAPIRSSKVFLCSPIVEQVYKLKESIKYRRMYCEQRLRELAVKYRQTHSIKETCEAFEISATALNNRVKRHKQTGNLANKPLNRKHKKTEPEKLLKDVQERPDDFNCERAQRFTYSAEAIRLAMKKLKMTQKKDGNLRRRRRDGKARVFGKSKNDSRRNCCICR